MQGRPLIFAAMAAAEAEAEIAEPTAWMAVATSEPEADEGDVNPVQTEHSNGSSQFVNGYPTPRSASPNKHLPGISRESEGEGRGTAFMERGDGEHTVDRGPLPPSPPTLASNLPTALETQKPRLRKLSKSRPRVTRMTEASQPALADQAPAPSTFGAKPPTPVDDAPPPRSRIDSPHGGLKHTSGSSASAAAVHSRHEKHGVGSRRPPEVSRSPPPRIISSESPVPSRPVKVLTERQMEKLSATKGLPLPVSSTNGVSSGSQHRPEPPVPAKSHSKLSPPPHTPAGEPPILQASVNRDSSEALPKTPPKRHSQLGAVGSPTREEKSLPEPPRSPPSPEEYAQARSRRRGKGLEKARPEGIENVVPVQDPSPEEPKEPTFYPIEKHLAIPALFGQLLRYLSFGDWLALSHANKPIRALLYTERELGELVLERFLRTVGYARWTFPEPEPLVLTASVRGRILR